jgi:hypothetical protein
VLTCFAGSLAWPPPAIAVDTHTVFGNVKDVRYGPGWQGVPAVGVTITCSNGATTTSGADGTYHFDLPDGTYSFSAALADRPCFPDSQAINVSGGNAEGPYFVLGYTMSGRIRRPDGTGVPGVTVLSSMGGMNSSPSGPDGQWHINGMAGGYPYSLTPTGGHFTPTFNNNVMVNSDVGNLDFVTYRISGRVTDAYGYGAPYTWVMIWDAPNGAVVANTWSDADGNFTADLLGAGNYYVTCTQFGLFGLNFSEGHAVTLGPNDASSVDFLATGVRSISGHVATAGGQALSGVKVSCLPWGSSGVTDADGDYTIQDVPAGDWTLAPAKGLLSFEPSSEPVTVAQLSDYTGADFVCSTVDTACPTTAISPMPSSWVGTAKFSLTATDDVSGVSATYYTLNQGSPTLYQGAVTLSTEGTSTITYWSVDSLGNVEPAHVATVRLDHTPPQLSLDRTAGAGVSAVIRATASDELSGIAGVQMRVDGGAWSATDVATVAKAGRHVVYAQALDAAGNERDASLEVDVPQATTISLSCASKTKAGRTFVISGRVLPATASGQIDLVINRMGSRGWSRNRHLSLKLSRGKYSYSFRPGKGRWQAIAYFGGGTGGSTVFLRSPAQARSFTAR